MWTEKEKHRDLFCKDGTVQVEWVKRWCGVLLRDCGARCGRRRLLYFCLFLVASCRVLFFFVTPSFVACCCLKLRVISYQVVAVRCVDVLFFKNS